MLVLNVSFCCHLTIFAFLELDHALELADFISHVGDAILEKIKKGVAAKEELPSLYKDDAWKEHLFY